MLTSDETTLELIVIAKLFLPLELRGRKSISPPNRSMLGSRDLINLGFEVMHSHKSSYLLCSFLEYGGGCITPMELTLEVTRRVLIFRLPSCSCTSRHPKANYSLVPAFRRDNPINVKEPANLFRLASSVLLMAKEYCRYFIV
ncbi:hypothetical protein I2526_003331 [Escherichia coli]|nr:hypothetical protein [Escherichia coli]EGQ2042939.1 hypothetical protein [Escherichia coli]MCV3003934.1 hypothetical protein [Escherichia coli]HAM8929105.1 hypothetical protein [Escherichia coli]